MRPLSELECTVLGVVAKFGPLSPYAVRQHFASSTASRFSDSTGSIYPLLRRLERAGQIVARASARGRQARKLVSITRSGRTALRTWLVTPPSPAEADAPPDPLRTKLYFASTLTARQRERFFAQGLAALEERVRVHEAYLAGYEDEGPEAVSRLAARGSLLVLQARLKWWTEARDALSADA